MDIFSVCVGAAGMWLYSKWKKKDNKPKTNNATVQKDLILERVINLLKEGKNIFITGGAGTGKSYLLQQLKEQYPTLVLTSTTGVSAININGQTIHSWSGIGIANQSITRVVDNIIKNPVKYKQIVMCDMLAIDEISMLASNIMEYLDQVFRAVRKNDAPFGGIQVILIGDFFQLPPVVTDKNGRIRKLQDSDYCFNCKTWKDLDLVPIVLKEVKRQTDPEFVNVLNNLREGKTELNDLRVIWTREEEVKDFVKSSDSADILKLFSTNENADNYNLKRLSELDYQDYPFKAEDKINWYDKSDICRLSENIDPESKEWQNFDKDCKAPLNLQLKCDLKLKKGCRVMLLHNLDVSNGLANGSCGTVVGIKPDEIDVLFDTTNDVVPIQRVEFAMPLNSGVKPFKIKDANGIVEEIELIRKSIVRKQFPLRLAYGITIHKSQGMTFDKLIVDCGKVFADGQAYVALSRTRSLQGLYPINFNHTTVTVSNAVVDFYKQLDDISAINDLTNVSARLIIQAIKEGKKLKIKYHSNPLYKNEETMRTIVPQKLAYGAELNGEKSEDPYPLTDDKLYLQAFCELRQDNRLFKVDNIQDIEVI